MNLPLVSVCVITYNSSQFVQETLNSIALQSYDNIELIISDDCSTDNTIELCNEWLLQNEKRFGKVKLVSSLTNNGVSANCNRAIKEANGEWIKLIAGDDLLFFNCIKDNIDFIFSHNEKIEIVFSLMKTTTGKTLPIDISFFDLSPKKQYKLMLQKNYIPAPSSFYLKQLIIDNGSFDEEIPFIEDYPFWLRLLKTDKHFFFLNKLTVEYRIHQSSLSQNDRPSKKICLSSFLVFKKYIFKDLFRTSPFLAIDHFLFYYSRTAEGLIHFFIFLLRLLNPIFYYNFLRRKLSFLFL